jgi:hypothetical protein
MKTNNFSLHAPTCCTITWPICMQNIGRHENGWRKLGGQIRGYKIVCTRPDDASNIKHEACSLKEQDRYANFTRCSILIAVRLCHRPASAFFIHCWVVVQWPCYTCCMSLYFEIKRCHECGFEWVSFSCHRFVYRLLSSVCPLIPSICLQCQAQAPRQRIEALFYCHRHMNTNWKQWHKHICASHRRKNPETISRITVAVSTRM